MKTPKKITVFECECGRCGHKWTARVPEPKQCAKCHSPYWNKERVRNL